MSYIGKGVEVVTFNTATTLDVAGNITVGGTVDGRDVATDGTKLDTIAANAIANLSEDTTPQLGGNLDLNTSNVIGTGNINVTGSITGTSFVSTGDMSFTNNSKAIFGTSPSLEIYHDGSNSILDDVGAGNFKMQLAGADKLEITSTGVDVTGTVTADGLTVDGTSTTSGQATFGNDVVLSNDAYIYSSNGGSGVRAGWFFDGTNQVVKGFTAGSERLRIDSSGQLIISGNGGSATNSLDLSYNGASGQANIQADSSGGNTYLTFGTSSAGSVSERLRIDSNGNMGIGGSETTVFNGVGGEMRLVVLGNDSTSTITNNTNSAIAIVNTNHTAGNLAGLHFGRADTDYSPNYAGASIVAQFPEAQVTGQYPKGDLAFLTSTATNSAPSEKMRIDSLGNVGIGASLPSQELHIKVGNGAQVSAPTGLEGSVIRLENNMQWESAYGTSGGDFLGGLEFASGDTSTGTGVRAAIKTTVDTYYNTNSLAFYTAPSSTSGVLERMRIDSSGNVGIGTSAPSGAKLEIFTASTSTDGLKISRYTPGNYYSTLRQDSHGLAIHVGVGGTVSERVAITPNGITFNGDTAAANALDDYEEGAYNVTFSGTSGTPIVHSGAGYYIKIGRMVYIRFYAYGGSNPTVPSGSCYASLPFTADTSNAPYTPILGAYSGGLTFSAASVSTSQRWQINDSVKLTAYIGNWQTNPPYYELSGAGCYIATS